MNGRGRRLLRRVGGWTLAWAGVVAFIEMYSSEPAVRASDERTSHHMRDAANAAPAAAARSAEQLPIRGPLAGVSRTPTAVFDRSGRLFVVFVDGMGVYVTSSMDSGKTFALAVPVNRIPEAIDANGESRPQIALGSADQIYVTYTRRLDKAYSGDVSFSRSADQGRTFSEPMTLNDDGLKTGHRFAVPLANSQGELLVVWIDKRDLERAKGEDRPYEGAALYYAVSNDQGHTFGGNRKLRDHICECCRLAAAQDIDGLPVILWRDILTGGIRDHSLVRFTAWEQPGTTRRASFDGWEINGCPHKGPALAVGSDGTYHVAWFTGVGPAGAGSFYARSSDRGVSYSKPIRLGSDGNAERPSVLSAGGTVYLAWKERHGSAHTAIRMMRSFDQGRSWSAPLEVAGTEGASDQPFVLAGKTGVFLSWFTDREGYRLVRLS